MIKSNINTLENSEALMTVGQVILHYQYKRLNEDTFNNWCVGILNPKKELEKNASGITNERLLNQLDPNSITNWKVDCKKTADIAFDRLLKRGFSADKLLIRSGYSFKPVSQYHVYIYRKL